MPPAIPIRLREIVASLIYSPLYFSLTPPQRLALVKTLARRHPPRPRRSPA